MYGHIDIDPYPVEQLLEGTDPMALDTETLGHTRASNIPIYYSWKARDIGSGAGPVTTRDGYDFLDAICRCKRTKIFHNSKFDNWVLNRIGFIVQGTIEDTILMHCLLDEHHLGFHKLKVLSRELLGRPRMDELVLHRAQKAVRYNNSKVPQQILHKYAHLDAEDTHDLYFMFKPQLEEQNLWGLYRHLVAIEMVYLKMFQRGVCIDMEGLEEALEVVLKLIDELKCQIWIALEEEFLVSSPQQLGAVLKKHFPLTIETKSGWCTDKDALEPFRGDPRMQVLLAWKFADKARQYLQGYKKRQRDGKVYSDYKQTTTTGRSKSKDPNLENIPKQRGRISIVEVGNAKLAEQCAEAFQQVRRAITVQAGSKMLAKDYKQIEYRCFAFYSRSERLISALERGEDFHTYVCNIVFGDETAQLRYITKIINYGLIYGMGNPLLITRIKMYHSNPYEVLRQYERLLPEMRETQRRLKSIAAQKGYLIDVFGRRYRYLSDRPHAVVAWLNQGTAANIKKLAMEKTDPILEGTKSGLILEIHDELIWEIFPEDAELTLQLHTTMEDFPQLGRIPVLVDTEVGPNLLDLKDVTPEEAAEYLRKEAA